MGLLKGLGVRRTHPGASRLTADPLTLLSLLLDNLPTFKQPGSLSRGRRLTGGSSPCAGRSTSTHSESMSKGSRCSKRPRLLHWPVSHTTLVRVPAFFAFDVHPRASTLPLLHQSGRLRRVQDSVMELGYAGDTRWPAALPTAGVARSSLARWQRWVPPLLWAGRLSSSQRKLHVDNARLPM